MELEVIKWTWATPRRVTTPLVQKKGLVPRGHYFFMKSNWYPLWLPRHLWIKGQGSNLVAGLVCVVMLLKSSFEGEVVRKRRWGPDQIWQKLQKGVRIVKSQWNPLHCHWSLWIATVLKKVFVWIVPFADFVGGGLFCHSDLMRDNSFTVFCHDVFTVKCLAWK